MIFLLGSFVGLLKASAKALPKIEAYFDSLEPSRRTSIHFPELIQLTNGNTASGSCLTYLQTNR